MTLTTTPQAGVRPPPRAGREPLLPAGCRVVADPRTRLWRDGRTALGGVPWGVVRLGPAAAGLLHRAVDARARGEDDGVLPAGDLERVAADRLVERGLVHPAPEPADPADPADPAGDARLTVDVVVPCYQRPELLAACLDSLTAAAAGSAVRVGQVVVVDDASPSPQVGQVARERGATVVRHERNAGPAAARNTGLAATTGDLVAFLDADCVASPGWLDRLVPLFADPRVGAAAPRVVPRAASSTLLARHETTRSALDMGPRRALVRRGGPLGFLPSAALVVRRAAVSGPAFDEGMRVGEDVDLVWRLAEAGWHLRYEPAAGVEHEMRLHPGDWALRRYQYGTSAAALDRRHPSALVPARVSGWNLGVLAALALRRPVLAAAVAAGAATGLGRTLRAADLDVAIAPTVVGQGVLADAAALGHALRREWWPLGWLALAAAPRSRTARLAATCMLVPVGLEWARQRPDVDPVRYAALRLAEDAAYGSGVITSAVRGGRPRALLPHVRLPHLRRFPPRS